MNKIQNGEERKNALKHFFNGKMKDFLLLVVLAIVLIFAAWQIFRKDDSSDTSVAATETEEKVIRLLEEIDGVGEANVIVCESENGVESVVVVCEGANDLRVVMDVREAVSAALGTEQKAVKIYLKKNN